jgi:hypothetical protein
VSDEIIISNKLYKKISLNNILVNFVLKFQSQNQCLWQSLSLEGIVKYSVLFSNLSKLSSLSCLYFNNYLNIVKKDLPILVRTLDTYDIRLGIWLKLTQI